MSGLYNLVFGENTYGEALVTLLNDVQAVNVGRYRDAWVEAAGDDLMIRVHTRNGGGNREWMDDAITSMEAHPWYVRDEDDDFDSTYADFWFRPDLTTLDPATARGLVDIAQAPVDMTERWQAAIDAIAGGKS